MVIFKVLLTTVLTLACYSIVNSVVELDIPHAGMD
jgi:hypothetical protein